MYGYLTHGDLYEKYQSRTDGEKRNEMGECIEIISWHNAMACACMPTMIALIALVSSLVGILANEASRSGSSYDFSG